MQPGRRPPWGPRLRALAACVVGCGALLASQPAVAAPGALRTTTASVPAATVVDVSTLPPPSPAFGAGALPQLRPAAPIGLPAAAATAAASPNVVAAKPVLGLSTVLANPLRASDNPFLLDPPDQAVAAGGGAVVQMVNLVGRIWTGTTPGPVFSLSSFFGTGSDSISDPWVFYDQTTGRFFASIFDITFAGEAMAVSQTSNPSGGWFIYHIPWPAPASGTCPDQGKLGISDNMVALGANLFTNCTPSGTFAGATFQVFPKSAMLTGAGFSYTAAGPISTLFSVVPAISQSSTATQFFAGVNFGSGSTLHIVTATGNPAAGASLTLTDFGIAPYSNPPEAPQKGSTALVDAGDTRVQRVAWQNGHLGFSFNEACVPTRDTVVRACARFVDFRTTTNTVAFSKTVGKRNKYLFSGAPAFNSAGQLVSPISISASSMFPSLDALALSTTGKLSTLVVVKNGAGPETSGRYGDYNAVAINPLASTSFWAAGQIGLAAGDGNWNTAVALVTVS